MFLNFYMKERVSGLYWDRHTRFTRSRWRYQWVKAASRWPSIGCGRLRDMGD